MQNKADYRITLNGASLGAPLLAADASTRLMGKVRPRLISLTLSEKRGEDADQLDIALHDHDGRLEIPMPGQVIGLALGWLEGGEVAPGLVDKGLFKVDEAEWSGPPDIVTIRARSADFAAALNKRRERSHVATTLGDVVKKIAADNGLQASVAPELASIALPAWGQDQVSDGALLRALGRRYDAAATVKGGKLIFAPIGTGATASGLAIPAIAITRASGDRYTYRRTERGQFGGVEARWYDQAAAERKTVLLGGSSGDRKPKRLKRVYATEGEARAAAEAELRRMARGAAEFDCNLAIGRPEIYPERSAYISGFKAEADAKSWLVAEATHKLDASGLSTSLKLETRVG